jgi:Protein of unknown function (DUF1598)
MTCPRSQSAVGATGGPLPVPATPGHGTGSEPPVASSARPTCARSLFHGVAILALLALAVAASTPASAQIILPGGGTVFPFGSAGVYIDADATLRVRQTDAEQKLQRLRLAARQHHLALVGKEGNLCYVSLPTLLADVRKLVEAGKPIPQSMRLLNGMTKLRYVFVYPAEHDLVIAGDYEPWDATDPVRPIGKLTGRPVLQLDDLVVALRVVNVANAFGCSIDMPIGAQEKVTKVVYEDPATRRLPPPQKQAALATAVGPQTIRFFGMSPDTRFAFTCVEADYRLKRLAMGLDPTPVPQVQVTLNRSQVRYNRLWFTETHKPVLVVSPKGDAFELRGLAMELNSSGSQTAQTDATEGVQQFTAQFNQHFQKLADAIPSFADLWNLTDLGLMAALIARDKLHEKVGWDVSWLLASSGYPVQQIPVPRLADTVVGYRSRTYVIGGVNLRLGAAVGPDRRQLDDTGKLAEKAHRPEAGLWLFVPEQVSPSSER